MTKAEMSELFALMLLAWPNAPMFRPEKLEMTIALWTACLPEVDFLTGSMATLQLCRTCHYPPSIAQMREAAEAVSDKLDNETKEAFFCMRNRLPRSAKIADRTARTIARMGGETRLLSPVDDHSSRYNLEEFRLNYRSILLEEAEQSLRALAPKRLR